MISAEDIVWRKTDLKVSEIVVWHNSFDSKNRIFGQDSCVYNGSLKQFKKYIYIYKVWMCDMMSMSETKKDFGLNHALKMKNTF